MIIKKGLVVAVFVSALAAVGALAFRSNQSTPRFSSFMATLEEKRYDFQGKLAYSEYILYGVRSDGSWMRAARRISPAGTWVQMRTIQDVASGKFFSIDPSTESVTTYNANLTDSGGFTPSSPPCSSSAPEDTKEIAGFRSGKVEQTGTDSVTTSWRSEALNCFPLQEIYHDGQKRTAAAWNDRQALFVVLGEPPADFFSVPTSYTERSPSEVFAELARRHPGKLIQPRTVDQKELAYRKSQP